MTVRELHELFDRYTVFDFEYEVGHHMCFGNDGRYLRKFYDYEIGDINRLLGGVNLAKYNY